MGRTRVRVSNAEIPKESTPRTWGEPLLDKELSNELRINPTHVGRTCSFILACFNSTNQPHARGENYLPLLHYVKDQESTPRTWGEHTILVFSFKLCGINPTHVGRTCCCCCAKACCRNQPHARGENLI